MAALIAKAMENANKEVKHGYRQSINHKGQRVTCTVKLTSSRNGQVLKRSTLMAHRRVMHGPTLRAQPHMPERKANAFKLELEE
jgi:UDP-N-acetylenolpyruvoylglucosamine reductase